MSITSLRGVYPLLPAPAGRLDTDRCELSDDAPSGRRGCHPFDNRATFLPGKRGNACWNEHW